MRTSTHGPHPRPKGKGTCGTFLFLLAAVVWTGACGGDDPVEPPAVPTTITISPETATLVSLGETVQLTAIVRDQHGQIMTGVSVDWASGEASVATVSGSGLVTATGNGTATVEASAGDAVGTAAVTTEQQPSEVRVSPSVDTLVALEDTVRLSAEALDANGHAIQDAEFTWASDDEAVLTVDGTGLVTAMANGSASIQATTGDITGSAEVTVEQRPSEVAVSPATSTLGALEDTVRLGAEALDANGHAVPDAEFAWVSGDELVLAVDETGLVTAVGRGSTSVTATAGDISGSAEVTVDPQVLEVRVSPGADTLVALGDTVRLAAEALDANGHLVAGAEFVWASGDESVLTVDGAGLVTAVASGSASVTATAGDISASAEVTVDQRPFELQVSATDTLAALGDTVRLSAEVLDANGHALPDAEFMWSSADESVVTVDTTGLVMAVSNGSAEVGASFGEITGTATVTVWQRAAEMRLWPLADTLLAPDTLRLSAEASDANGHVLTNAEYVWSSGNVAVATVDADGLVRALKGGSAEVMVTEAASLLSRVARLWVLEPRAELEQFYEALGGLGWTNSENWGTDAPLDTWHGVTTDSEGRITELDLSDNGLKGDIPAEIALLEHLEVLDLSGNGVPGEGVAAYGSREAMLPGLGVGRPEYNWMAGLAEGVPGLDLAAAIPDGFELSSHESDYADICGYPDPPPQVGEGLTGSIPPELGVLTGLRVLDLSENSLSGSIPPELGNLESLEVMYLGWNILTGSIPAALGRLANLEVLGLCSNLRRDGSMWVGGLSGSIPAELGDLTSLEVLHLGGNSLTAIPARIGDLRDLRMMNVAGNFRWEEDKLVKTLTGSIPPEFGNLENLETLNLSYSNLTGAIPPELGGLLNLRELYLESNHSYSYTAGTWVGGLTGSIPPEIGNLQNLEILALLGNQLSGPIPPELGDLQNLRDLALHYNQLSGSIPPELGNLQNLRGINVSRNRLTGLIPPELGNLRNLGFLSLGHHLVGGNALTGPIPSELGDLRNLEALALDANQLTGPIPPELGDLQNLRYLTLSDNHFTDPIPPELGNLRRLNYLRLAGNELTGMIPRELENMKSLSRLWLHDTELTGAIPAGFVELPMQLFHWYDTTLCAPSTETFQQWLESIPDHQGGETCPAASGSMSSSSEWRGGIRTLRHTPEAPPSAIGIQRGERR